MTPNIKEALKTLLEIPEPDRTPDVNIIIASISTTLGNYSDADRALSGVKAVAPDHPELNAERARWLLEVQDIVACIDLCKLALAKTPQNGVLTEILIDGLFRQGNFSDSLSTYEQFGSGQTIEMAVIAARSAMRLGNAQKAIRILDTHLVMDTPMPDAHYLRAQLAFLEKNVPLAIAHLEKACTLAPTLFEAVNQLIHSYLELNQWDKAIPWIDQMIARNPNDAEQHFRLALANDGLGKFDNAIVAIDAAIALDAVSVELRCAKVGIWVRSGQLKDAMATLKELVGKHGQNPIVYQTLGVAFQHQDRWDDAIKAFKKALELGGDDPVVYAAMASAHLALGQSSLAKAAFERAANAGGGAEFEAVASQIVIQ